MERSGGNTHRTGILPVPLFFNGAGFTHAEKLILSVHRLHYLRSLPCKIDPDEMAELLDIPVGTARMALRNLSGMGILKVAGKNGTRGQFYAIRGEFLLEMEDRYDRERLNCLSRLSPNPDMPREILEIGTALESVIPYSYKYLKKKKQRDAIAELCERYGTDRMLWLAHNMHLIKHHKAFPRPRDFIALRNRMGTVVRLMQGVKRKKRRSLST